MDILSLHPHNQVRTHKNWVVSFAWPPGCLSSTMLLLIVASLMLLSFLSPLFGSHPSGINFLHLHLGPLGVRRTRVLSVLPSPLKPGWNICITKNWVSPSSLDVLCYRQTQHGSMACPRTWLVYNPFLVTTSPSKLWLVSWQHHCLGNDRW